MMYTTREQELIKHNNLHAARVIAVHRLREERRLSLRQIGRAMGLSHERVRQLLQEKPLA